MQGAYFLDSKLAYDNIKVPVTLDSSDSGSMFGYGDKNFRKKVKKDIHVSNKSQPYMAM